MISPLWLLNEDEPDARPWWRKLYDGITVLISPDQLGYMLAITVATIVKATGTTILSGEVGLLFSFGRATKELQPGFRLLIPFLQVVKRMPSRSQSLDLPAQRIVTSDGLVFHVDANLVYRVVDIRKAIIEIDHLRKGMLQILGLGVQETLRGMVGADLDHPERLRDRLVRILERRLDPWGVQIEHAGLTTITPSARTLRVTQFARAAGERVRVLRLLHAGDVDRAHALGLVGTRKRFQRRTAVHIALAARNGAKRRVRAALLQRGVAPVRFGALEKMRVLRLPWESHSNAYGERKAESKPALASK